MPHKRFGVGIVALDRVANGLFEINDAGVGTSFDPRLTDVSEEAFDLIEPCGGGGGGKCT
jgi:hypothetical protein